MAEFADHAVLKVQAGHGGHGCASVHREKFKPLGGPDGGNGGRGGSVILEVDPSTSTLLDFHRRPIRKAGNGVQGEGSNRNGAANAARQTRQNVQWRAESIPARHWHVDEGIDHGGVR